MPLAMEDHAMHATVSNTAIISRELRSRLVSSGAAHCLSALNHLQVPSCELQLLSTSERQKAKISGQTCCQ
jgi:hypothetical protein